MKKIIIIVVLILLLAGGGGAAYYFFFMEEPPEEEVVEEAPPPPAPIFLRGLGGLTVPVIRNGQVVKFMLINVAIELYELEHSALARAYIPKLEDEFFRSTHAYFASTPVEQPVNTRAIAQRLKKVAVRILGTKVVKDVFIEGIFERKGS